MILYELNKGTKMRDVYKGKMTRLVPTLAQSSKYAEHFVECDSQLDESNRAVQLYITLTNEACKTDNRHWTAADYLGGVAIAFRHISAGSSTGQQLRSIISARLFENVALAMPELLISEIETYYIASMIEHFDRAETDEISGGFAPVIVGESLTTAERRKQGNELVDAFFRAARSLIQVQQTDDTIIRSSAVTSKHHRIKNNYRHYRELNKPALILPISASGGGKSTAFRTIGPEYEMMIDTFSFDDVRQSLYNMQDYADAYRQSAEDEQFIDKAKNLFLEKLAECDYAGKSLYLDNTNLTAARRAWFIGQARQLGYSIHALLIQNKLETVINRQQTRTDKTVPDDAVVAQYLILEMPTLYEVDKVIIMSPAA